MWETMIAHFYAFSETQDVEELHRLRVEIKKIFALTVLLDFSTRTSQLSISLKPLKTIFTKAGEIRNIQLTLQTIMWYTGKKSSLCELQQTRLANLIKTFCSKMALYVKNFKKVHTLVVEKIYDIKNNCVLDWYEDEFKKLSQFFIKKCDHKNMHKGRKTLKKLLYVYAILQKPLQKKLNLNRHYLRELEEIIGKWHDVVISLEILSNVVLSENEIIKKLSERKAKFLKSCRILSKLFPDKCYK